MATRQHYKLATTGKLGQDGPAPASGSSVMNDRGPSGAKDSRKGSYKVPGVVRVNRRKS